ncbi:hypothetical protein, conserved [Trypanosoma brucei brucei TREU927]|uniref:EngB-type G domain-containing protein n=1 Tax=Trypanosoma brucei brucei (strain 927/4 GUTat10.1) TaxID=185431 RepID=Q380Y8_TRYB2|nr:hypothetical protein, conserved [Trypanosoma brucei brucei TREU927]EAN80643.1 hypothetical protein, conserved [Trypanosoma brucei brucei TREU927]
MCICTRLLCCSGIGQARRQLTPASSRQKPWGNDPPHLMSPQDELVAKLSDEVFSRGNMHLKNVDVVSALPEGLHSFPEVCFIGKPNVGKSSIISCLLRNPRLGRAGRVRGTTRLLQFFNVGDALLLVDTPGYGGWKGRHLPQSVAERASAFAILFRYLALRSKGPLKRVYWVMEATKPVQPRDEEIFVFLRNEQIPFSIIISKLDYFGGDGAALRRQVESIYNFLGTEDVPVLGVRADSSRPERCINMTALQHDITHYCTTDLVRVEDLSYNGLKELSYAPPTFDEVRAVEERYPVESFIVPQDDNLSLQHFVSLHQEAKSRHLTTSPMAMRLSTKEKLGANLIGDDGGSKGIDIDEGTIVAHSPLLARLTIAAEGTIPDSSLLEGVPLGVVAVSPTKMPQCFHEHPSIREGLLRTSRVGHTDLQQEEAVNRVQPVSPCPSPTIKHKSSEHLSCKPTGSLGGDAPGAPPFSPSRFGAHMETIRTINGVCIPKSMVPPSVVQLAAGQAGSFAAFAQHSGANAYEEFLTGDATGSGTFLEATGSEDTLENKGRSLRRPREKSMRRCALDKVLKRYVACGRKQRSLHMQAEGYMCPWLAGAGQQARSAVFGVTRSRAHAGGMEVLKGLKRTGFGGQSYSARTMKNRGRSTKKTGFWAA